MNACFCIGPQPGFDECPCRIRERTRQKHEDFARGYEIGFRMGRGNPKPKQAEAKP